jgi:hypothetical protein
MILQNDATIAKSQPLFKKYGRAAFGGIVASTGSSGMGAPPANDSINSESPGTSMALQQMSYLVSPIAQNLIAAQTLLDDEKLVHPPGSPSDVATLAQIRQQLLETIAFQSASLDLVNGFVTTQQLGEIQHAGETYIQAIQGGNDMQGIQGPETPSSLQDPNSPGLPSNPYQLDLTAVPGLAVGYNPLSRIVGGLQWLQSGTTAREGAASKTVDAALATCGYPVK